MKSEKTNGAKVSRFDVRADYANIESERIGELPPINPKLAEGFYVVAVAETSDSKPEAVYLSKNGMETNYPVCAQRFDTYGDALKWAVENCDIPAMDYINVPRGFERPRYPRVCYLRIYTELTEC